VNTDVAPQITVEQQVESSHCEINDESNYDATSYKATLQDKEHQIILDTLNKCNGKRKDVAEILGMSPRTLRYKLAKMRDMGIPLPA
jgi:two-component system response regulator FlrC